MKRICCFLLLLLVFIQAKAQQSHFAYIQSDNNQPFYVQIGNAVYSSSASGYLILSNLRDSVYKIIVGFPQNRQPKQSYMFVVRGKDLGFSLRSEKGEWILYDLQTNRLLPANDAVKLDTVIEMRTDPFATMLASLVNDPSIKEQKMIKEVIPAQDTLTMAEKPELPVSVVTHISSHKTSAGMEMLYVDISGQRRDTVNVFIPFPRALPDEIKKDSNTVVVLPEVIPVPVKPATNKKHNKARFIDMSLDLNKDVDSSSVLAKTPDSTVRVKDTVETVDNKACKHTATDEDFIKLRKKMASKKSEQRMIAVAKGYFVSVCFTTEQIRQLSFLLFGDAGRYAFYEAAYKASLDPQRYDSLRTQLSDPYYLHRFDELVHSH